MSIAGPMNSHPPEQGRRSDHCPKRVFGAPRGPRPGRAGRLPGPAGRRAPGRIRARRGRAPGVADRLHRLGRAGDRARRTGPRSSSTAATRCRSRTQVDAGAVRDPPPDRRAAADWLGAALPKAASASATTRGCTRPTALERLQRAAPSAPAPSCVPVDANPVDRVWADQPPPPLAPVVPHRPSYAGEAVRGEARPSSAATRRATGSRRRGADAARLDRLAAQHPRRRRAAHAAAARPSRSCTPTARVDCSSIRASSRPASRAHLGNGVTRARARRIRRRARRAGRGQRGAGRSRRPPRRGSSTGSKQAGADDPRARPIPCLLPKACKNAVELAGTRARASARRRRADPLPRLARARGADRARSTRSPPASELEAFRAPRRAFPRHLSFDTISGAGPERRDRPLPRDTEQRTARSSRARSTWSIPARSISTAPPTSRAPSPIGDADAPRCATASPAC